MNQSEPEASNTAPIAPAWLDDYAREEWDRVTLALAGMGILSADDRALIVAYCGAWSDYRLASETLVRDGFVTQGKAGPVRHPMVMVKAEASGRLLRLAQQFGLSPSARARLHTGEKEPEKNDKSRFFKSG